LLERIWNYDLSPYDVNQDLKGIEFISNSHAILDVPGYSSKLDTGVAGLLDSVKMKKFHEEEFYQRISGITDHRLSSSL
jgi:hypothetical protein